MAGWGGLRLFPVGRVPAVLLLELLAGRPDRRSSGGRQAENASPGQRTQEDGRKDQGQDGQSRPRTNGRTAEDRRSSGDSAGIEQLFYA